VSTAPLRETLAEVLPDRPFRVTLWDGTELPSTSGDGLLDPLQGSGKWDCNRWTWSIAQGFFDLDAPPAPDPGLPGAYGGGGTINFSLPVERSDLRFQVDGHVDVWYG